MLMVAEINDLLIKTDTNYMFVLLLEGKLKNIGY